MMKVLIIIVTKKRTKPMISLALTFADFIDASPSLYKGNHHIIKKTVVICLKSLKKEN